MLEKAYVLHRWPYQEHSLIVEFFAEKSGRFRAVAKGARRAKRGSAPLLQPFRQLQIAATGRHELKTLTTVESNEFSGTLHGDFLYCGFYINELMQRLVPEQAPLPRFFEDYTHTLSLLRDEVSIQPVLRKFEWLLLTHLELDFSWVTDVDNGDPIAAELTYYFRPGEGFARVMDNRAPTPYFNGKAILAMAQFALQDDALLQQFKHIMRRALSAYLGNKPLRSRELFQNYTKRE